MHTPDDTCRLAAHFPPPRVHPTDGPRLEILCRVIADSVNPTPNQRIDAAAAYGYMLGVVRGIAEMHRGTAPLGLTTAVLEMLTTLVHCEAWYADHDTDPHD